MANELARSSFRTALVLYGSETGNAQDVAEEVGRLAERLRFATRILELNAIQLSDLLRHAVVIVSISTTGQGELPANAQVLWRALRRARLPPGCLRTLRFASFGLGDSSYPKFNWAHRKLYNRLVQLGAQAICPRGEADEQHPEGIDGTLVPWLATLRQHLLEQYPLPAGVEPVPDDVLLPPKWTLEFVDPAEDARVSRPAEGPVELPPPNAPPPDDLLPISSGFAVTVDGNTRVTPPGHWQDVRLLSLATPADVPYGPGDVITIYPKNFPADVSHFLHLMGWTSLADVPLKFVAAPGLPADSPPPLPHLPRDAPLTLRGLLTNNLDIMAIPRRSFFSQLQHYTKDEDQLERLREFTAPELLDELYDYTTRPRRSILEVLADFHTVSVPWQRVASVLPPLRGRQFSIASGGVLKRDGSAATRFDLLIAIVRYRTVIKRIRQGVCTRYVASLKPGQGLNVTISRGGLHVSRRELERPIVMVGPGTGVAPMRALIYERAMWRAEQRGALPGAGPERPKGDSHPAEIPRDVLFFGCRNEAADYFFKEEWERAQGELNLEVFPAFSRDQRLKVYVQDLIRQQSALVFSLLSAHDGMVYVCGSSGKMPAAVRSAFLSVFEAEGGLDPEEAEAYLARMEREGRYKQETW